MRALPRGVILSDGWRRGLASQLLGWAVLPGFGLAESMPRHPARSGTVGLSYVQGRGGRMPPRTASEPDQGGQFRLKFYWRGFGVSDLLCRRSSACTSPRPRRTWRQDVIK